MQWVYKKREAVSENEVEKFKARLIAKVTHRSMG